MRCGVKLIVQPQDGLAPIVSALRLARKEIDLVIFRCDRPEIQTALELAVKRGVKVRTLIAHTNHGGEKHLRKLEQSLLDVGATVARTGDEFARYHGKFMVIDRTTLWLLGFNLTALDVARSRSFGVVTRRRAEVQQALKLFEADATRQPYEPADSQLVVSPENAREALSAFLGKAKQELLIYDPKVSDPAILKVLRDRAKAGVAVKIIGKVADESGAIASEKFPGRRLHVRAIVRDRRDGFVGSQSLRKLELDKRREVGILLRNAGVVSAMVKTFEEDWAQTESGRRAKKGRSAEEPARAETRAHA